MMTSWLTHDFIVLALAEVMQPLAPGEELTHQAPCAAARTLHLMLRSAFQKSCKAKPAARAGLCPRRPDTTLAWLKRPSLELMWKDNGSGRKTRHGFVGLVILWCIAVRKA
ncbi:hypothetical protein NQZ68_020356 [Dissostichus eleginoides]|nr:hypothetical protein NQZ68_020356 [Dissostichus eleginoides]